MKTGQVSKIIDPMGEFESYAYDEENRLKRKVDRNGNRTEKHTINGVTSYHYDNIGQLQEVNYPNYNEKLFYDKRGNRTSCIKNGA